MKKNEYSYTPNPRNPHQTDLPLVYFDNSLNPMKSLANGYKKMYKAFKHSYNFVSCKDKLSFSNIKDAKAVFLPAPQTPFSDVQINDLNKYLDGGGRICLLATESTRLPSMSHLNALTTPHGISVRNDSLIRLGYHRDYPHPKDAFINNISLTDAFSDLAQKPHVPPPALVRHADSHALSAVFPLSCTLSISNDAVPLLTSGSVSLPTDACVGAVVPVGQGLLMVLGSVCIFDDAFIEKAGNLNLARGVLSLLLNTQPLLFNDITVKPILPPPMGYSSNTNNSIGKILNFTVDQHSLVYTNSKPLKPSPTQILPSKADREKVAKSNLKSATEPLHPSTSTLSAFSSEPRYCLRQPKEITTSDSQKLFNLSNRIISLDSLGPVIEAYEELNVPLGPIQLPKPNMVLSIPQLQYASHPPILPNPTGPPLEYFNLDDEFLDIDTKLKHLAFNCTKLEEDGDMNSDQRFILGTSNITGTSSVIRTHKRKMRITAMKKKYLLHKGKMNEDGQMKKKGKKNKKKTDKKKTKGKKNEHFDLDSDEEKEINYMMSQEDKIEGAFHKQISSTDILIHMLKTIMDYKKLDR